MVTSWPKLGLAGPTSVKDDHGVLLTALASASWSKSCALVHFVRLA